MLNSILRLPTPTNLSYNWGFGSLLGIILTMQIISGLFLTFQYSPNVAFNQLLHIMQNMSSGWLIRYIHSNGASFFFIFLYFHIARGLFYKSFKMKQTWMLGVTIYLMVMITAFLGYILPWGQMSYWGATVITNLISSLPYIGNTCVIWFWGGYSISTFTISRFFSLHYILPFLILVMVILHLAYLHKSGSSNPLSLPLNSDKMNFHPLYTMKDSIGLIIPFFFLSMIVMVSPFIFMDSDNFEEANFMRTPPHIQPEWYFLFAYSILRSVPNKLGGVIMMMFSIFILYLLPFFPKQLTSIWYKLVCIIQFVVFIFLTWLGAMGVEFPYIFLGQLMSVLYFVNFIMLMLMS
uniref:Cytochrome b n=1 Tax=Laemobothrion tinnunculi TaxID=1941263 RepID=A0A7T1HF18_9NEOP|nr:cytochrome b [Laemobothrion tinnunculi]